MVSIHDLVIYGTGILTGVLIVWFVDWLWLRDARAHKVQKEAEFLNRYYS